METWVVNYYCHESHTLKAEIVKLDGVEKKGWRDALLESKLVSPDLVADLETDDNDYPYLEYDVDETFNCIRVS